MQYSIATRLQMSFRDELKGTRSKCDARATCTLPYFPLLAQPYWPFRVVFRVILQTKRYCLPQQNNEQLVVLIEIRCVPYKIGTEFLHVYTNFRHQRVGKQ